MSKSVTFSRWKDVLLEEVSPMLSRKLLTGQRMMLTQVFLNLVRNALEASPRGSKVSLTLSGGEHGARLRRSFRRARAV